MRSSAGTPSIVVSPYREDRRNPRLDKEVPPCPQRRSTTRAPRTPATRSSSGSSAPRSAPSTSWASTWATASACIARWRVRARSPRPSSPQAAGMPSVTRASGSSSRRWAGCSQSRTRRRTTPTGATRSRRPRGGAHDESSLAFIAPVAQLVDRLRPAAARARGGLPDRRRAAVRRLRRGLIDSQARFTAPMFDRCSRVSGSARSRPSTSGCARDPPARVADVACGEGRSSLAIARGYPKVMSTGSTSTRRRSRRRARASRAAASRTASGSTAATPPASG